MKMNFHITMKMNFQRTITWDLLGSCLSLRSQDTSCVSRPATGSYYQPGSTKAHESPKANKTETGKNNLEKPQ